MVEHRAKVDPDLAGQTAFTDRWQPSESARFFELSNLRLGDQDEVSVGLVRNGGSPDQIIDAHLDGRLTHAGETIDLDRASHLWAWPANEVKQLLSQLKEGLRDGVTATSQARADIEADTAHHPNRPRQEEQHDLAMTGDRPITASVSPAEITTDQLMDDICEKMGVERRSLPGSEAVLETGRSPGMSAMTAAHRVSNTLEEADRSGAAVRVSDHDLDALARVDPEAAEQGARRDWHHRRPERTPTRTAAPAVNRDL